MSEWIKLNLDSSYLVEHDEFGGEASPSVYDVPQAIRVQLADSNRRVLLEIRYIDRSDEPLDRFQMGNAEVHIGKHSRRVRQIEIQLRKPISSEGDAKAVVDTLSTAIGDLRFHRELSRRRSEDNYELTSKAVTEKRRKIYRSLALTG